MISPFVWVDIIRFQHSLPHLVFVFFVFSVFSVVSLFAFVFAFFVFFFVFFVIPPPSRGKRSGVRLPYGSVVSPLPSPSSCSPRAASLAAD